MASKKRRSSYVPMPKADPETRQRLHVVMLEMTAQLKTDEAAGVLQLSRLRYETLRNRGLQAMVDALTPGLPGRPVRDPKLRELTERVKELEQENAQLQREAERNEQLIMGLTQTLREIASTTRTPRRARASKTATKAKTSGGDDDGETHRARLLERSEELVARGLTRDLAAIAVRRDAATLRRWRVRRTEGRPLARRRGPSNAVRPNADVRARVVAIVRATRGLVGADALSRTQSVSRRQAAAIKQSTLQTMERERVASATRVRVAAPGVIRGLDQLWVPTAERMHCVLALADGAIPYRTTLARIDRYDGENVAAVLARDLAHHGAPLVLRLDRAKAHDVAAVHALCERHEVLILHGPPRCPTYYGQLERQNAEHRAWLEADALVDDTDLDERLREMQTALNALWPRRTLGWSTSESMWNRRRMPTVDRAALRERVLVRASRLRNELPPKAIALGTHHRLAIEHELVSLGFSNYNPGAGARCFMLASPRNKHGSAQILESPHRLQWQQSSLAQAVTQILDPAFRTVRARVVRLFRAAANRHCRPQARPPTPLTTRRRRRPPTAAMESSNRASNATASRSANICVRKPACSLSVWSSGVSSWMSAVSPIEP